MQKLIVSALLCCLPLWAAAQSAAKPGEAKAKPKAAPAEVHGKAKPAPAAPVDPELTPAELAIAQNIYVGTVPCELGAKVTIDADEKKAGYFFVQINKLKYHMSPVVTSTGAVRLEDQKAGAVWLQLGNKSMLMNQKLGQRLADECMSPLQTVVAEALKKAPAQSVLDAPAPSPVVVAFPAKSASDASNPTVASPPAVVVPAAK